MTSAPQLLPMPQIVCDLIANSITDSKTREYFADLTEWANGVVAAFNKASVANDRMASALERLVNEAPDHLKKIARDGLGV